jgi:hypothetical protein
VGGLWFQTLGLQIAVSLDACVQAYIAGARSVELQKLIDGSEPEDKVYGGYKTVILAKADEDVLVSFIPFWLCKGLSTG